MKLPHQCVWLPAKQWKWNRALPSTTPRLTTVLYRETFHWIIQSVTWAVSLCRAAKSWGWGCYVIELQIPYFVYQCSHRLLPPCFSEYFKFTSSVHSYSTRQSSKRNLYLASVNTTQYGLRSLKFTGPRLWNSLPTSLTTSNSLRIFCKTLKNSMLNCYSL